MRCFTRPLPLLALLLSLSLSTPTRAATVSGGSLAVHSGSAITDIELRSWINEFIPNDSKRLLILTQCYGGNMLDKFKDDANTAVMSATSKGEKAIYTGYDRGASFALKPYPLGLILDPPTRVDAGTVHATGFQTRARQTEHPATGGKFPLTFFSLNTLNKVVLEHDPDPNLTSRHILFFAGKPDAAAGRDVDQRNQIKDAFKNEQRTTVTTVGGPGGGGWDFAGTAKGLRDALAAVKKEFDKAADKSREQFILYLGDHGDAYTKNTDPPQPVPPKNPGGGGGFIQGFLRGLLLGPTLPILPFFDAGKSDLQDDPNNVPGFSFFLPIDSSHQFDSLLGTPFLPGDFSLDLMYSPGASPTSLSDFEMQLLDLDTEPSTSGIIGDQLGEGIRFFFPMTESLFINQFGNGADIQYTITNNTDQTWLISDFLMDTGAIPKGTAVPLPSSALLSLPLLALLLHRRLADGQVCPKMGQKGWTTR